jgi:lipopolysaccharide export system protein LptC
MERRRLLLDRLTSWAPVFLLGGLAALTWWLDAQVRSGGPPRDGTARHDADMYIENFSARNYDADGTVRQSLSARRAEHHPDDRSIDFVGPSLALTDPGKPRMAITADAATLSGDRETVTFRGNVRATRDALPPGAKGEGPPGPVTMAAETLRVVPRKGTADTDGPVTIEDARGIIRGTGIAIDNNAHTIKLKSGVSGSLAPGAAAK